MNIVDIQCFLYVAKYNSITHAAEKLFLTRQTVSRHIASLEKEIGCELFVRTPTTLYLTPAGVICNDFFTDVKKNWDYTTTLVRNNHTQHLKIGCDFSMDVGHHLADAVSRFRSQHPSVDFEITTDDSIFLIDALLDEELDLAIIKKEEPLFRSNQHKFEWQQFTSIELVLLVSRQHRINGACAADYSEEPCYIGNSTVKRDAEFEKIMSKMIHRARGIHFTNLKVLPNMDSVYSTVLFSKGMTIDSTDCSLLKVSNQVRAFPLGITFNMAAVWKKSSSSPTIKAFTDALQ